MRRFVYLLSLVLLAGASHAFARVTYNFNSDWKLIVGDPAGAEKIEFDDRNWKLVTLPRAWNEDDAFRKDIKELPTGVAWYRKHFRIPAGDQGKKVFIEFEGVRQAAEVWINGRRAGLHENGITAFGFDLTGIVGEGDNVIAVRTDNNWDYREKATDTKFQWLNRSFFANYGGINKNVRLHVSEKIYQTLPLFSNLGTTGIYVHADEIDPVRRTANIVVESEIRNDSGAKKTVSLKVELRDMNGRVVRTFTGADTQIGEGETKTLVARGSARDLNLWSWGYGYLYDVGTDLRVGGKIVDSVVTRTGFRKTEFANGMFKLNGRTLQLKGYAQRTTNEWPALGSAVPAWLSDFSNRMMVESNANLVRWMHVTPGKQDVESCDRVGLLQAMPAGDSESDVEGIRWTQRTTVMRDAIIYNRNNPSIIFYESGNKGVSEEHMKEMKAPRDRFDPFGGRASGSREMLDSKVAEYGGEMLYINKSARIPMWAMEYSRDEGLRKYWDDFSPPFHKDGDGPLYNGADASVYNRNQDSHAIENVTRWFDYWEARPGTGTRVSSGGVNIIFSDTNTHFRGAENYRRSGEVDAMRLPKDGFFAHQVIWDGWVDIERPRTHIIGHWNYAPGTKKNVYVVSSAEKVELLLNGKSLGTGTQSYRFLFTFKDVEWKPGELKAVGFDASGKQVTSDVKITAGEPFAIKLSPTTRPGGMIADGSDVALIDVEVVDRNGMRCPTALDMIDFKIAGPADWRGGIAQGPDNYVLSKSLPVENGVNRVIVRSTTNSGRITLSAASGKLRPSTATLISRPARSSNGLSIWFPSDGLSSDYDRGATPPGESFVRMRFPVEIAGVEAGSNAEKAANTIDDVETTDWISDGVAGTAWIKYSFAKPETVGQVVLKFVGWRTQSYPIRIKIDDRVVFEGMTSRSLGYVTFEFPPTAGSSLSIELTGEASNRDEFGNIIEITGQPDPKSSANKGGGKKLGIVEAEIYRSRR